MKTNTIDFIDEKGQKSELEITSNTDTHVNLNQNYKLQRPESNNKYMKKGTKGKGTFTSDIGIKSKGFVPVFTLAIIISVGVIIMTYLFWKL